MPNVFSRINISEDFSLFLTILEVDFFLGQCQIIFPGKIFLRILAYSWVIFFLDQCQIFFSDQYLWRFFSISDDFGSGFFSRSVSNNFYRKNISQDFSLLLSHFLLDQFQLFFFSDQYFWWFFSVSDDFGSGFFWSFLGYILLSGFFLD